MRSIWDERRPPRAELVRVCGGLQRREPQPAAPRAKEEADARRHLTSRAAALQAFAERVLSAAAGAAEATGGSLARPQAAGEPKPKGQSARRRAAKAAKAKKSFSLGDIRCVAGASVAVLCAARPAAWRPRGALDGSGRWEVALGG